MLIVDTSAWIEWLTDSTLGEVVGRSLPDRKQWLVPTIVQYELAKWLRREVGEDEAEQVIAFTQGCVVVLLDTRLALAAAETSMRHRLAMAHAVVYATALACDADLLTCDAHFGGLPRVTLLEKTSGGRD